MNDPTDLPPRPAQPVSPPAPAPAFPVPPEFTIGAAQVPAPPPAFAAPDAAFAAPDPAYTATPAVPDPATSPYGAQPYGAQPYGVAYPNAGWYPPPGTSPYQAGYGGYGAMPGYPVYIPQTKTNGMAIGSMATSIVGATLLFCYGAGLPLGLVGAILGHVSRRQIRSRGEAGDGMALAGIIIGWIVAGLGLVVVAAVIWFFAWMTTLPTTPNS